MYAATDEEIALYKTGPVRLFSVASPYVGDKKYFLAIQSLERQKRLLHLRTANADDIVTNVPFLSLNIGLLSPNVADACGGK